jgi:hypothetical protein
MPDFIQINTGKNPVVGLSDNAKKLINEFEAKLKGKLLASHSQPIYTSVDDILVRKYHLKDIDNLDFPDYRYKTEFITKGVRGNLQKSEGNVLNYEEGEKIIKEAMEVNIP